MKFQVTLLILAVTLVFADTPDRTEPRRSVQYELTDNGVNFQLQANPQDDSTNSKITFIMQGTEQGFVTKFKYQSSEDKSIEYSTILLKAIEYVPTSSNGFTPGTDTPTQVFIPNQYNPVTVVVKQTGNVTTYDFTIQSSNGVLTVVGHVVTDYRTNGTVTYKPNSVKLDYIVRNWNYAATGSKIALESRLQTGDDVSERSDGSTDRVEITPSGNSRYKGAFIWIPTVDADGTTVNVLTSSFNKSPDQNVTNNGDVQYHIFHTFDTTNRVKVFNWDPSIGVTSNSCMVTLSIGLILVLAMLF